MGGFDSARRKAQNSLAPIEEINFNNYSTRDSLCPYVKSDLTKL